MKKFLLLLPILSLLLFGERIIQAESLISFFQKNNLNCSEKLETSNLYKKILPSNNFNTNFLSKNINELIKISKELKINPIFVTQRTARWKLNKNQVYSISEGYDYYSREKIISETILKICEKYKLICIDGFNQLNLNNEDTYDLVHTNPEGSKKIANFIFKSLQKEGFK